MPRDKGMRIGQTTYCDCGVEMYPHSSPCRCTEEAKEKRRRKNLVVTVEDFTNFIKTVRELIDYLSIGIPEGGRIPLTVFEDLEEKFYKRPVIKKVDPLVGICIDCRELKEFAIGKCICLDCNHIEINGLKKKEPVIKVKILQAGLSLNRNYYSEETMKKMVENDSRLSMVGKDVFMEMEGTDKEVANQAFKVLTEAAKTAGLCEKGVTMEEAMENRKKADADGIPVHFQAKEVFVTDPIPEDLSEKDTGAVKCTGFLNRKEPQPANFKPCGYRQSYRDRCGVLCDDCVKSIDFK